MKFHYGLSLKQRLFDRLLVTESCLLWTGWISRNGYGYIEHEGRRYGVHRLMYELFKGPIPDGLQIDHLCRLRHCANPDHLEAVTCRVNLLRGDTVTAAKAAQTHCMHGHPLSGDNVYVWAKRPTVRKCLECRHDADDRRHARDRRRDDTVGAGRALMDG